ncbi:MAG: CotH kinase family protein [Chitinispirillales bacterium]|jgi:hypothetical protein|nr:CotH kinase family protein [Chitinispirillales bacterium]
MGGVIKTLFFAAVFAASGFAQMFTQESLLATGIPVISINTENGAGITSKEIYTRIESFTLTDPYNSGNNISRLRSDVSRPDRPADEIRGRGNATWVMPQWGLDYPKKPYRLRFTGQIGLLGLPRARNWVLLAEYRDPTLLYTPLTFELAKNVFEMPFTHNYFHVHLFLNGDYRGVYGLTEHKQVHENRINIDPDEGWYVDIDSYYDEEPKFRTIQYGLPIMIKSPEPPGEANMNNPAYQFVRDDWNGLCNLMAYGGFPENGYRGLIDINAVVDYLMVNEIIRNFELLEPKSMLAYKDKGKKIALGPVWDFDCGFGYDYNFTHIYFTRYDERIPQNNFLRRFYDDPVFTVRFRERWNEKYAQIAGFTGYIDNISQKIAAAAAEDTRRWYINGNNNFNTGYVSSQYITSHSEAAGNLKTWWNNRVSWLNNEFNTNGRFQGMINISSATVTLSDTSYIYDGAEKRPRAVVESYGKILTEGIHYTAEYANNTDVGDAVVTITGMGDYYNGSKDVGFTIILYSSARTGQNAAGTYKPLMTVRGRTLTVNASPGSKVGVRVVNMRGKTAARFNVKGGSTLSLKKIPAGAYIIEAERAKEGVRMRFAAVLR